MEERSALGNNLILCSQFYPHVLIPSIIFLRYLLYTLSKAFSDNYCKFHIYSLILSTEPLQIHHGAREHSCLVRIMHAIIYLLAQLRYKHLTNFLFLLTILTTRLQ